MQCFKSAAVPIADCSRQTGTAPVNGSSLSGMIEYRPQPHPFVQGKTNRRLIRSTVL